MAGLLRATAVAVLLATAALTAQEPWMWGGGYGRRFPPRLPTVASFDGNFVFCRLMYRSNRREQSGSGWSTDYPGADLNFPVRLGELTKTRISRQTTGESNHVVVEATDPLLFQCPFLLASDIGTAVFSPEEVLGLRHYLLKGGFLWVDDFWGERAWDVWASQIAQVLAPADYPILDVPLDHQVFRAQFQIHELPQIPSISHWRRFDGETSERGDESAVPDIRAISDREGRIMVLMTHDTDISDSWEREGEDPAFFYAFSPKGYALAINALLYAMTH